MTRIPFQTFSANLSIKTFAIFGLDAKVLRAERLEALAVFENSLTSVGSKVCHFRLICPLAD